MNTRIDFSDDLPVLAALGMVGAPLIGFGGEARVYAADERTVLRLLHPGATLNAAQERSDFLAEIAAGATHVPFATPQVERVAEVEGRIAVIERKLPGTPFSEFLLHARGEEREASLMAYFNAALMIREIDIDRPYWGDILSDAPIREETYRDYLRHRLAHTRKRAGALADLLADGIAEGVPDCGTPGFVHFDLFPGNILMKNGTVTAVIDFGATAMRADPRLEVWSAAAYLDPAISPNATDADRAFAHHWLARQGLDVDFPAARRWIAAYWCFAADDQKVVNWCRSILV